MEQGSGSYSLRPGQPGERQAVDAWRQCHFPGGFVKGSHPENKGDHDGKKSGAGGYGRGGTGCRRRRGRLPRSVQ